MTGIDLLLIAALALVLGLAVRRIWRTRRTGGCGCGCDGCASRETCGTKPK